MLIMSLYNNKEALSKTRVSYKLEKRMPPLLSMCLYDVHCAIILNLVVYRLYNITIKLLLIMVLW